ncbi:MULTISPECIES: hypothetical protein [Dermacoccus]|uniref:hypothetical protein n=1 Tax=Dermacoccus TaxID=57495 RepID=UPI001044D8ED|nr:MULTISPECIES: hypothetical protein [Dermacoccus]MBO1758470.1 hypothetical protein [Dermacoccus sp. NHGro5]NHC31569.1 hypothetical protein [Dermacoccus nishinomiyaensis]TCJ92221.1 hypothetical protein EDC82_2005 [Dermacoccus sp. SAI-028]
MFPTNQSFGNSVVLAAAARLPQPLFPPTIPGYVQPWLGQESSTSDHPRGVPAFVWGPAARERRHRAGYRNHTPIGAPWLYLLALEANSAIPVPPVRKALLPPEPEPNRLLYFPHHGLQGELAARRTAIALGSQAPETTIALTHEQAASEATRRAYEDVGARVVDLGPARQEVGSVAPFFLQRILQLIRVHRSVRTDVVGTYALFAHSAGAIVEAHVPRERLDALVERELGPSCVMPAQELRAIFDWSTHV